MGNNENCPEELKLSFTAKMAGLGDLKYAPIISQWTKEAGTMLPKGTEEIIELMQKGQSAIVVNALGEVVSHIAAAFVYSNGFVEVGALATGSEFQGHGAGTMVTNFLLEALSEKYPGKTLFALANSVSAKIFGKIGGSIIPCSALSDEVWEYCKTCPNNPNKGKKPEEITVFECCDTPYDLTSL